MNHQLALAIQLNDEATLADFCWGSNTVLQYQLAETLQGRGERLYYIWGGFGCGKSHLLQACCQANNESAIYLPLQILREWGPQSIEGVEEQALIALDDIDCIAKDKAWEEALFHLYNRVKDNGKTNLLIAGNHPLSSLPIELADLRSRLAWGLVSQLNELDDDLKITTLQQGALKRGIELPGSAAHFLITRCARNMHDLQQILNHLDEASLAAQRKITVPFIKSILEI